jgi:hypothetical protein
MYLYEGARQASATMMLHALALGADKNFTCENDQGRTPLIQTIRSVRIVLLNSFVLLVDLSLIDLLLYL